VSIFKKCMAGAVVLASLAVPAAAQEFKPKEAGDFLLRVRGIAVLPDEDSTVSVIGGDVDASNEYVPEIDISYFFTENIALELIAATTEHDMAANNTTLGNVDLGEVSLLPPTLTAQYHFMPKSRFSPYLGVGINYTLFYDEEAAGGTVTAIEYDNSVGLALQAGMDYAISGNWSANLDVKKVWINTDVSINNGAIAADVDLDPWIIGVGIGYRF